MSYTITITETKDVVTEDQSAYCQTGTEFISLSEYSELSYEDKKRWDLQANDSYARVTYGYPPKRSITKTIDKKIFEQTVEVLNTQRVISAINGLVEKA